jgi:hypothetical protein
VARLVPLIIIVIGIYFWFRARRRAESIADHYLPPELQKLSGRSQKLGFLPQDQLDTEHSGPLDLAEEAALSAARAGDRQPATALLAAAGTDWERRTVHLRALARAAADDDAWLLAWETARPEDPDTAVLRAATSIERADRLRGSARPEDTTPEQLDEYRQTLRKAQDETARAVELNPSDPSPRIAELSVALGLGYPHEQLNRLWSEIVALAPHHYAAHFDALQYWCQKGQGSVDLATDFAAKAAAGAPQGSLLTALPLISWFEHEAFGHTDRGFRTPEVSALVTTLAADVAAAPADHPRLREVRLLLTWYLVRLHRYPEALEQFRLVDGFVGAFPWNYQPDPAKAYIEARDETVRRTA